LSSLRLLISRVCRFRQRKHLEVDLHYSFGLLIAHVTVEQVSAKSFEFGLQLEQTRFAQTQGESGDLPLPSRHDVERLGCTYHHRSVKLSDVVTEWPRWRLDHRLRLNQPPRRVTREQPEPLEHV